MYLLGRTKNSDPHRNVLSDCGLGPMPHGQSVHLPGARGPRQKGTVPGDQGGVCGPVQTCQAKPAAPDVCWQLPWRLSLQSPQGSRTASGRPVGQGRTPLRNASSRLRGQIRMGWGWLLFTWHPPSPHSDGAGGGGGSDFALLA